MCGSRSSWARGRMHRLDRTLAGCHRDQIRFVDFSRSRLTTCLQCDHKETLELARVALSAQVHNIDLIDREFLEAVGIAEVGRQGIVEAGRRFVADGDFEILRQDLGWRCNQVNAAGRFPAARRTLTGGGKREVRIG